MRESSVLLVGLPEQAESIALVALEALGQPVRIRRSAETAASDARASAAVVSAMRLPGDNGWSFLCGLADAGPKLRALFHPVPLGFAPDAPGREGVTLFVGAEAWLGQLLDALSQLGWQAEGHAARLLSLMRTGDFAGLEGLLGDPSLDPEVEGLALKYAAALDPDRLLQLLSQRLHTQGLGDSAQRRVELSIDLVEPLGRAGFQLLAEIAGSDRIEPQLRGRALRSIAERFELSTAWPVLAEELDDASAWVRGEAAELTLLAAQEAGAEGLDLLLGLAHGEQEAALRSAALRAAAELLPPQRLRSTLAEFEGDAALAESLSELQRAAAADPKQRLAEASEGPIQALRAVAQALPARCLAPLLQPAREAGDPDLCSLSLEIAFSRDIKEAQPSWSELSKLGTKAERAALYGVMQRQRSGLPALKALAAEPSCSPETRAAAVRLLAVRGFAADAALFLESLLDTPEEPLQAAIRFAARALGPMGDDLLRGMAHRAPAPAARVLALRALASRGGPELLRSAVRRALSDPDGAVQAEAVRIATSWIASDPAQILDRLLNLPIPGAARAAFKAATHLEQGGFQIAAYLALDPRVDGSARREAMRWLRREHPPEDTQDVLRRAEAIAEAVAADTAEAEERSAAPEAQVGLPPPAGETAAPAKVPEGITEGLVLPPMMRSLPPADDPSGPMSEARAREALRVARGRGRNGYRQLVALAESERVPDGLRAEALRFLASDFPDREVLPILKAALASDSEARTRVALSSLMVRDDVTLEPFAALLGRPQEPLSERLRGARFIARRFPTEAVATLESLLDCEEEELRRVALQGLFTAIRFTPSGQVEGLLIQLIGPDKREEVRASAARSLAAFGGPAGREALLKEAERAKSEALAKAFRRAANSINPF